MVSSSGSDRDTLLVKLQNEDVFFDEENLGLSSDTVITKELPHQYPNEGVKQAMESTAKAIS